MTNVPMIFTWLWNFNYLILNRTQISLFCFITYQSLLSVSSSSIIFIFSSCWPWILKFLHCAFFHSLSLFRVKYSIYYLRLNRLLWYNHFYMVNLKITPTVFKLIGHSPNFPQKDKNIFNNPTNHQKIIETKVQIVYQIKSSPMHQTSTVQKSR